MYDSVESLRYFGNVCISGLTAAGKTTHSHLLAGEFGLTYVSGSQIQLNFLGVSPIQTRDFWITEAAKPLWDAEQFKRIDAELLRIESTSVGCIFDTSTMPWRHRADALCIWLESSLESRSAKSIVSHHGKSACAVEDYPAHLAEKDAATMGLYKALYGIDIGTDLTPFDLILNISSLIESPSLGGSLSSISLAHSVIRPAAAWYLTGRQVFKEEFEHAVRVAPEGMVVLDSVKARVEAQKLL